MKIPTDLDPKPPLQRILAQNPPPLKEFLDPPLTSIDNILYKILLLYFLNVSFRFSVLLSTAPHYIELIPLITLQVMLMLTGFIFLPSLL